jgi:hypothetical protein
LFHNKTRRKRAVNFFKSRLNLRTTHGVDRPRGKIP